jgi:hypothetical protein
MPWVKGQSGNPGGRPAQALEVKEIRKLAQAKSGEAFKIILHLMRHADRESVKLAAALGLLKIAGLDMSAASPTIPLSPSPPQLTGPELEEAEHAAMKDLN